MADLTPLIAEAQQDFTACTDLPALDNAKAKYLGNTGSLTEALKGLGKLSAEDRPAAGAAINVVKQAIEQALQPICLRCLV
jgi:phenylalanyl-tRNA synthetase alpha chain